MAPLKSPEAQLKVLIDKFDKPMASLIRAARRRMRALLPTATELVYDNYNFFVIGYGPNDRTGQAAFSLAAQAKGLALCFLWGKGLPDPKKLLRGSGSRVRNVRVESAATLTDPEVLALIGHALAKAPVPYVGGKHQLLIKSISAKQRPRRVVMKS